MTDSGQLRSQIAAAKAVAEQAQHKKTMINAAEIFKSAESVEQVLGYLAGGASMCWTQRPRGEFKSEQAQVLVAMAGQRLSEIIVASLAENMIKAQAEANAKSDLSQKSEDQP